MRERDPELRALRRRRRIPDEVVRAAVADINRGMSWLQMQTKYGIAQRTIETRVAQDGLLIRRGDRHYVAPQRVRVPVDLADLGYMAGIIDGEGTVSLVRVGNGYPAGRIWVFNTSIPLMRWLASWGGAVRERPRSKSLGTKPCYVWGLQSRADVLALLTAIRPYLRIKGELADAVIEALAERDRQRAAQLIA